MPILVMNYQKNQTVAQLKKVYSVLKQATEFAKLDYGEVKDWDYELDEYEFVQRYYKPYLKVLIDQEKLQHEYYDLQNILRKTEKPTIVLADGTYIFIYFHRGLSNPFHIVVDLNGKKKPNRVGRDIFVFSILNNQLQTYSQYTNLNFNRREITGRGTSGQCSREASGGIVGAGSYCSRLIEMDAWEIKDDYPW